MATAALLPRWLTFIPPHKQRQLIVLRRLWPEVADLICRFLKMAKGSIKTTRQEDFKEETVIALVVPIGEDNEYKLYSSAISHHLER